MADQPQAAGVARSSEPAAGLHVGNLRSLYQYTSVLWMLASASLGGYAYGSALLVNFTAARLVVPALAAVVFVSMLLRMFAPGRPQWTRWTLPLLGSLSVCVFILALFGIDDVGFSIVRLAAAGLTLIPALVAYLHWAGERMVSGR